MSIHHFKSLNTVNKFIKSLKNLSKYKLLELKNIAKDLNIKINNKDTKKTLIEKILNKMNYYGPDPAATLWRQFGPKEKKPNQEKKQPNQEKKPKSQLNPQKKLKPYEECSIDELREEADTEGILSTGSKSDIVARLKRLDAGSGPWEDSSTEFIRSKLVEHGYISTGNRGELLEILNSLDNDFEGAIELRTTKWLKDSLANYGVSIDGSREELLLRLYPLEMKELLKIIQHYDKLVRKMGKDLNQTPKVVYRHSRSSSPKKYTIKDGISDGIKLGIAASIAHRIFGESHKPSLKF
jgi:hypothetical protein